MFILKSSQWAISYLPLSVVFLFTALVFLNAALKSWLKISGLSPTELGLIFTMSLVGASIPTWGTSTYMIAVIAAPQYFASPENQWQSKVVAHIEEWLVPSADRRVDRAAVLVDQPGDGHLLLVSLYRRRAAQAVGRIRAPALRANGTAAAAHLAAQGLQLARLCPQHRVLGRLRHPLLHGDVECGHLFHAGLPADPARPFRSHPHRP